jgi:hypothetical protein
MVSSHPIDGSARAGSTTVASVLRLNSRLFDNCLNGVSDAHLLQRPNEHTNSIAFIACHLVDARHFFARYLHLEPANPLEPFLNDVHRIEDVRALPDPKQILLAWHAIAPVLESCVAGLTLAELKAPSAQRFPIDGATVFGGIGFLLQHESYHIGQLALLRKFFGYPAMKYGSGAHEP